jgi:hypothetical protein
MSSINYRFIFYKQPLKSLKELNWVEFITYFFFYIKCKQIKMQKIKVNA